jgi:integrase
MDSGGYFIPAPDGGKYNRQSVRKPILEIYCKAGIPLLKNNRYPRVHDLRHSHAVHAMEKMLADGYDLYCSLPILSTYLGHKGLKDVESYLRLTDSKFAEILESEKELYHGVIPEVNFFEEE